MYHTEFLFVSSCFIRVRILSRRVWRKALSRFQLMIFVFLHQLQKSQEFLARRLVVVSANNKPCGELLQRDFLKGKNRWDPIGRLRNEGLRARHPSDGATAHVWRVFSKRGGGGKLERLEERLSPGAGILSRKLPTIIFLCIWALRPWTGTFPR